MSRRNSQEQRTSFNSLVESGTYSEEFDHPAPLKDFVTTVIDRFVIDSNREKHRLRILDSGCGTGTWLSFIRHLLEGAGIESELFGFDLSDGMVDLARRKLAPETDVKHIKQGDLLDGASYKFDGEPAKYDMLFVFDAIQQLPPAHQFDACALMVEQLLPGGVILMFDHDSASPYGRAMARKKFLTKYFGIPLVPRYYCNAKYPPLSEFAAEIDRRSGVSAELLTAPDSPKQALVIKKEGTN